MNLEKNISFTENQIRRIDSSDNRQINAEITQLHEIATKLKAELKRAEADRAERIRKVDIQGEAQNQRNFRSNLSSGPCKRRADLSGVDIENATFVIS